MNRYLKDLSNMRKLCQWLEEKSKEKPYTIWSNGYARAIEDVQLEWERMTSETGRGDKEAHKDAGAIAYQAYTFSK